MAIYLVGETIDAKRAHQRAQGGELIPLVRGVYVDHDGDAEAAILGHAVRIAQYLYPNAYLSSASAVLLAPTPDGRLFISGRRNQRTIKLVTLRRMGCSSRPPWRSFSLSLNAKSRRRLA